MNRAEIPRFIAPSVVRIDVRRESSTGEETLQRLALPVVVVTGVFEKGIEVLLRYGLVHVVDERLPEFFVERRRRRGRVFQLLEEVFDRLRIGGELRTDDEPKGGLHVRPQAEPFEPGPDRVLDQWCDVDEHLIDDMAMFVAELLVRVDDDSLDRSSRDCSTTEIRTRTMLNRTKTMEKMSRIDDDVHAMQHSAAYRRRRTRVQQSARHR